MNQPQWNDPTRTPQPAWQQQHTADLNQTSDYFAFRTMVTPLVIRVVYVLGVVILTIYSLVLFVQAGSSQTCGDFGCVGTPGIVYVIFGLITLTLGNLGWRILCEQSVVFFSILDQLRTMSTVSADTMRLAVEGAHRVSSPGLQSRSAPAQVEFRVNETEILRETEKQYGDASELETQAWRKPSAFALIVTNQRVLVVRPREFTVVEQQIVEDVPLAALTRVTAETIGPMRNLQIVRIEYGSPHFQIPERPFGVRFDSLEAAEGVAARIRQAAGLPG